jgi:hypothetical protein
MMTFLLGSVSASAMIAAGPVGYPSYAELTFKDTAHTGADNTAVSLNFDEVGRYLVIMVGASGGAGAADSPITITDIGGFEFEQIGHKESDDYEEVTAAWVIVTTPGTYAINFTYSGTSYRRAAICWLANAATNLDTAKFYWAKGKATLNVDVKAGEAIAAAQCSRGGTVSMSGMDFNDVPSTIYEGTDPYAAYSHKVLADNASYAITITSSGSTDTRDIAGFVICGTRPEFQTIDIVQSNLVIGGTLDKQEIRHHKPHIVFGTPIDRVSTGQAVTHVILEAI